MKCLNCGITVDSLDTSVLYCSCECRNSVEINKPVLNKEIQMTLEDLKKGIKDVEDFLEEQSQLDSVLKVISPSSTGVVEFGCWFVDSYVSLLEKSFGDDKFHWISWYIFENDLGKAERGVIIDAVDKETIKVKSVEDLYLVMMRTK